MSTPTDNNKNTTIPVPEAPKRKFTTIEQVFNEATGKDVALVQDNEIYYLVLNRKDNTVNLQMIKQINECLDQLEKTKGPACLVTLGTDQVAFSTGFDSEVWAQGVKQRYQIALLFQRLMSRILTLPIPTCCVYTGHAFSAGLFLGLVHDFRMMKENKAQIALSDLKVGGAIPPAYGITLRNLLNPEASRLLIYGGSYKGPQAKKLKVVDKLYKDNDDLITKISLFAKEFSKQGDKRGALAEIKTNLHWEIKNALDTKGLSFGVIKNQLNYEPQPKL
eukprot:403354381